MLGGQLLLLAVAVGTAAVFSFLYISAGKPPAVAVGATPPAPPPGLASAAPASAARPVVAATHEPTHVLVEQVLVVQPGPNQAVEKVIVRTPAVFPTGTVQWTPDQVTKARNLQGRLAAVLRHQDAIGREIGRIEAEWSQLVQDGVPMDALLPDSPSVPHPTQANPEK